jgi:hypothetical protein
MVITFDFDDTLKLTKLLRDEDGDIAGIDYTGDEPNVLILSKLKKALDAGHVVHIVTSRHWSEASEEGMKKWLATQLADHGGLAALAGIHFTDGKLKRDKLLSLGSQLHFDDSPEELLALPKSIRKVQVRNLDPSWDPPAPMTEAAVRRWVRSILSV